MQRFHNFQGSGVFLFADVQGLQVLLGKRLYPPYQGIFTVPTGQSDHTSDSHKAGFFVRQYTEPRNKTAIRELYEECLFPKDMDPIQEEDLNILRSFTSFAYNWTNFYCLLPVSQVPKIQVAYPKEVVSWNWYRVEDLPKPYFPGIPLISPDLKSLVDLAVKKINLK